MAGLPGTGLGGIFYAVLILWMAARESWLLARGRSAARRWCSVGFFAGILAAIVLVLGAEFWLIQYTARTWTWLQAGDGNSAYLTLKSVAPALATAPFMILAAMLVVMHSARLILRDPRRPEEATAAG